MLTLQLISYLHLKKNVPEALLLNRRLWSWNDVSGNVSGNVCGISTSCLRHVSMDAGGGI